MSCHCKSGTGSRYAPRTTLGHRLAGLSLALAAVLGFCTSDCHATTFSVTSTADTGAPGTLRWAINQVNAAGAGSHSITFSLPANSTIALTSALPTLNNPAATVSINGSGASGLNISGTSPTQIFTVQNGAVSISSLAVVGTGGMSKTGTGTLTIAGNNTYTGGTTVSSGVLQGNTASVQGNIQNNANVTFNQTSAGTYVGVMTGTGSLTKIGTSTLTLSGANTYTGGTTVSAGVLQGNTTSLQGNITDNANVTFNQGTAGTYAGVISGTGSVTKTGAGTLTFSGANTYTGGTTVSAGSLRGDATSVRGNISNNANVTFDQGTAGTYSGVMSGTGNLTKTGAGTLTLSGANTYTGGTTVSAGSLQGTTTSIRGNIANNSNVTFDQATAGTYSGAMSGSGSLTKTGAGTLTLSGTNTYTGGTTVSAGVLQGSSTNLQGNIRNDANVTFNQTSNGTYAGAMSGTGSLTKLGTRTLILTGENTYTGGTTVSAGVLQGDTTSLQGDIVDNANVTFNQGAAGTYSGVLSGTGSLTKTGAGTLTLSGANTYTGGTTVSAGSLRGDTTSVRGNIANSANVTFDQDTAGTYSGVMSGSGNLTKAGDGTLTLSGANTYTGGTTVSGGSLQGSATSVRGNIANNANVTFDQATAGTYSGVMSGSGNMTKIGAGTLTLSGANTYSGGTSVLAGSLQGTSTNLQGNILNEANVTFNQSSTGTYAGVMSGTGSLTKLGTGTLTLSGENTYTGGTTVSAGVLQGNTSSLQGDIVDNANVTFNQGTAGNYAGVVSGTGSLTKTGAGTLTLSGANTYTGGTTVSAGSLRGDTTSVRGNIANSANVTFDQDTAGTYSGVMSGSGNLTKAGDGSLTLSGANTYTGGTTVTGGSLQGSVASVRGNIANNANVTFDQTTAGTYSDVMSGSGSMTKIGAGTLTLSGANSYSGGTTVSAGVLQGNTTSLQGNIANDANVTFNQTSGGIYAGIMSGVGSLTKIGSSTLTLSGANTYTGGTTVSAGVLQGDTTSLQGDISDNANVTFNQATAGTYGGVISGTGSLTKTGAGTLTLSGANTYTGVTTVTAGSLRGDTTSVRGNISNSANVNFDQDAAGTYAGVMSGTGNLTKTGAGTLTLSGANTYTGGTTVSAGSLQGTSASVRGNIANDANVTFDQASAGSYAGAMSGSGSLTKTGAGTLTLTGVNTYTGGTNVSAGVLQGTSVTLRGDIANSAVVQFNQGTTGAFAGAISGAGSVLKTGNGTLTFSGANTYTGGTTVSAGVLQGDTTSLQGNIANNARVYFNQSITGTYAGIISGAGSLFKLGTGTTILSGANTYTGGTTVTEGVLQGDTTSLRGPITNNANVTFDQATDGTYAGVMSGAGGLAKTGAGRLELSAANTYTGGTNVEQGVLSVNGSVAGNTTVSAGGTLGGNGTLGGDVLNEGTVAAGNSIDTLNISGNYTQAAGSAMQVELDSAGTVPGVNNDQVLVSGATFLNGGEVNIEAASGSYTAGSTYTFLTSSGGITGQFAGITDNIDFLHAQLGYTANSAFFTLMFDQTDFAALAQTGDELAVANYLDSVSTSATGDLVTVLVALDTATDDEARMALNQMSGELFGTLAEVGVQNTTLVLAQLSQGLRSGTFLDQGSPSFTTSAPATSGPRFTLVSYSQGQGKRPAIVLVQQAPTSQWSGWVLGLGLGGAAKSDGNATGLNYGMGGSLLGIERTLEDHQRLGFFGGYLGTQLSTTNPTQTGSIQGGQFGAYNYHDDGFNYYSLITGLQFNGYETQRMIDFNGIDRQARGNFDGWQGYGYLERGVKFGLPRATLQPFAALQYIYLRQNSFTETGADSLNLNVAGVDANSLRSLLGGRMQLQGWQGSRGAWLPELRASWLHEFLQTDSVVNSYFAPIGGGSFAVQGINLGRDWALLGGGLQWQLSDRCSVYGNYDTQFNAQQVFHVGSAGLQLNW